MHIAVRTLDGRSMGVEATETSRIKDVRALVEAKLCGSFKILARGVEAPAADLVVSLGLKAGEFLIALPTRKRKAPLAASAIPATGAAAATSVLTQNGSEPLNARTQSAQLTGVTDVQPVQEDSAEPDAHGASAGLRRQDDGPSQQSRAQVDEEVHSPPRDESTSLFTLLPGYISRPNPSPHKPPPNAPMPAPPGGFLRSNATIALDEISGSKEKRPRLQQREAVTSGGNSDAGIPVSSGGTREGEPPTGADLGGPEANIPQQRRKRLTLPPNPVGGRGRGVRGALARSVEKAQDTRVLEGREGQPGVSGVAKAKAPTQPLTNPQEQPPQIDRMVNVSGERQSTTAAEIKQPGNDVHASLWEDLARELQNAPIQAPEVAADLTSRSAAIAGEIDQREEAGKDRPAGKKADVRANKLLRALASEGDLVLASKGQRRAGRKKASARKLLPGGQDVRLTQQGRLNAKEAAVVAELPLPKHLERLEAVFRALNTVYCFLLLKNIQASWSVVRAAVTAFPEAQDATIADVEAMAELCPEVVFVRDRHSVEGPRSIKELNAKNRARRLAAEEAAQYPATDPLSIQGDGFRAAAAEAAGEDQRVIEISDAGRHSVASIANAMAKLDRTGSGEAREAMGRVAETLAATVDLGSEGANIHQDDKGLGAHAEEGIKEPVQDDADGTGSDREGDAQAEGKAAEQKEMGVRNATLRRCGAFRRGLIRAVMLLHDRFLNTLGDAAKTPELKCEGNAAPHGDIPAAATGEGDQHPAAAAAAGPQVREVDSTGAFRQEQAPQGTGRPAQASADAPRAERATSGGTSEAENGASRPAHLTAGSGAADAEQLNFRGRRAARARGKGGRRDGFLRGGLRRSVGDIRAPTAGSDGEQQPTMPVPGSPADQIGDDNASAQSHPDVPPQSPPHEDLKFPATTSGSKSGDAAAAANGDKAVAHSGTGHLLGIDQQSGPSGIILKTTPIAKLKGSKKPKAAGEEPAESGVFDPLQQGCWHSSFPIQDLTLAGIREVVREATQKQTLAERQGRGKVLGWDEGGKGNAPRPPKLSRKHEPCRNCTHMDVDGFLQHLQDLPWYSGQVTHIENLPARKGAFQDTRVPLTQSTRQALEARGISRLFKHQAEAIDAAMAGQDVVVSTSTASGKSLCYNIPILEALAANRSASAIYIFPTKALAQDQLRALRDFIGAAFPHGTPIADVYDGDTPKEDRGEIRERAQLLITNPDMLHQSLLPVHRQFCRILANLRYVIVDEGHAYRGVFGCHTALVLRRLRRVCEREYSIRPRFMVTSATIANPRSHICSLLGVERVTVVSEDGSPHGPQRFVLWNPPLTAPNHTLKVANTGNNMSRTEGRARKGERKRAAMGYGRKASADPADAAADETEGAAAEEPQEASLVMAAARIHRRRQAANLTSPMLKDRTAAVTGDTEGQHPDSLARSDHASVPLGSNPAQITTDTDSAAADAAEHAWNAAELEADAEQIACASPTEVMQPRPRLTSHRSTSAALPSQELDQAAADAAVLGATNGKNSGQPKVLRRQLSRSAIQAAMGAAASSKNNAHPASGVCTGAADALEAVTGTVMLKGDRPTFEPKDLVYRSDEPGSGHDQRPLLRRRLHGHRYGQKPGKAHPYGMYARTDAGTETQARLPGREWRSKEFKDKWGTAGVSLDQRRRSPIVEISQLLAECVQHGLRTIAFCKTRKLCELVVSYTREMLRESAPHLAHTISVYRAGYSPMERREIEQALFHGDLWAVAATNALELGLDVGSLDMTMHLGFQGSIASLRQQAGRAGRREQRCMSVYVAFDGPLDQYFMTYPRQLFDRPIEAAHIDPSNLTLLEQHLSCAAAETPLIPGEDEHYFGPKLAEAANSLVREGLVARHPLARQTHAHALHYIGRYENPASRFSLRAIDPDRYQIINEADGGNVMEEIEESKAFFQVYDGAVYMFQGRTYLCKKLDIATKTAIVRPVDLKYYTSIREHTDIHVVGGAAAYPSPEAILKQLRGDEDPTMAQCANAEVTTRWLGFHRIRHGTGEIFDSVDLFLPDVQFPTQAAYLRVPQSAKATLGAEGLPWREGLHAAMHAILNVVPLHMMCGAGDLGAECDNPYSARFRPDRLLVFDRHPGGIGLAYKVCDLFGVLMRKAIALVEACPCTNPTGCPGCIQHTACDQYNAVLNKRAGVLVLGACLQAQAEFREQLAARSAEIEDPLALLQAAEAKVR